MSSRLRLSSPEALAAYENIIEILDGNPATIKDVEYRSKMIVTCWSKAGLDVYDDVVLAFRSIESQPFAERASVSESYEAERNIRAVYEKASTEMREFIKLNRGRDWHAES